ncbi:NAD(P)/FAD-dependent oxidoreductase [Pseudoduganella sp. UC29_106]|uniref:NAD(P)/FAD-dependent oxidoreductase n=1 Tax=Pseudoduganella sp. UC29_106 TaxID=3374553 RepID=UPI00375734C3
MKQKILIIGGGFAGMWSALGAARLLDQHGKTEIVDVTLISPEPTLHLRPRLHEAKPHEMSTPLVPVLEAAGVRYVQGAVTRIRAEQRMVDAVDADGEPFTIEYDRLVLGTGSKLHRPDLPGVRDYTFSVDQLDEAAELDLHLQRLADRPASPARNTVVVVGGGFTGIEVACEMPSRLRRVLGDEAPVRVVIVERNEVIGPDLGPGPRPVITEALDALGVERFLGVGVATVDENGLVTTSGKRINAHTVVWTGGVRANALTEQLPSAKDGVGRLKVARDLRVQGAEDVFAAGDVAFAATDDLGNHAMMACQHAIDMGRYAGHNVAADLLGVATLPYKQPFYVTCLDLGPWGAMYSEGWDRQVKLPPGEAKALKRRINTEWIYPPLASRSATLAAADPNLSAVA